MSSGYEQMKILREALSRYRKAKILHNEQKRRTREKRRSIVLTCVAIITVSIFILVRNAATILNVALEKFAECNNGEMVKWLIQNGATTDNWRKLLNFNLGYETKEQIANIIRLRLQLTEQEIISASETFSEKIMAQNRGTRSGNIWLCAESVCIQEGYINIPPYAFYHTKYSDWRNDPSLTAASLMSSIRSWLSPELEGELLDRAVNALTDLCY